MKKKAGNCKHISPAYGNLLRYAVSLAERSLQAETAKFDLIINQADKMLTTFSILLAAYLAPTQFLYDATKGKGFDLAWQSMALLFVPMVVFLLVALITTLFAYPSKAAAPLDSPTSQFVNAFNAELYDSNMDADATPSDRQIAQSYCGYLDSQYSALKDKNDKAEWALKRAKVLTTFSVIAGGVEILVGFICTL